MKDFKKALHLDEMSDQAIHAAYERFNMKWQGKAEKALRSDRISRF